MHSQNKHKKIFSQFFFLIALFLLLISKGYGQTTDNLNWVRANPPGQLPYPIPDPYYHDPLGTLYYLGATGWTWLFTDCAPLPTEVGQQCGVAFAVASFDENGEVVLDENGEVVHGRAESLNYVALIGCPVGTTEIEATCQPIKDDPCSDACTPNPIHTGTGTKYLHDTDYSAAGLGGLNFSRYYNSQSTIARGVLGPAWRHAYDNKLTGGLYAGVLNIYGVPAIRMSRAKGTTYSFTVSFTDDGATYTSQDADITDKLVGITDSDYNLIGFRYTVAADNSIEIYDITGKLQSIQNRNGLIQTLTYSDYSTPSDIAPREGLLTRVTDAFGRQLNFTYDNKGRIATMTDPANGLYRYTYDTNNNLTSVTYPDLKTKTYRYNEAAYTDGTNLPHALTGIIDENDVRHASYHYNSQRKAYREYKAGNVNQYQISYSSDGSASTITDPLGTARTTIFTTLLGAKKVTGRSQPGGFGGSSNAITYDASGNVASRTDFNGNKTCYAYDLIRNLETARIEGLAATANCTTALSATTLTAPARKITTQWHSTYRLPEKVAEPKRLTTRIYSTNGDLLTKTEQATTDTTGIQGMAASVTGTAKTWTYHYNTFGQVLTVDGPRIDVNDVTTYSYDAASGNLLSIQNAAGHLTTLSNYDANGRVGRITDANGMTTDLQYSPRGWLTSRITTANGVVETTGYEYDGVGQLKKVTLPDGSFVSYTYDDAHRMTDIVDSLGNSIHYTLDAMGNRVNEQVKDPNGALSRQITRVYGTLNRLQTVTGGTQ